MSKLHQRLTSGIRRDPLKYVLLAGFVAVSSAALLPPMADAIRVAFARLFGVAAS